MLDTYQRVYLSRNHKWILCVHHVSFLSPYQMPDKLIYSYSLCLWRSSLLVPDFCHYITFSLVYVAVLFILLSTKFTAYGDFWFIPWIWSFILGSFSETTSCQLSLGVGCIQLLKASALYSLAWVFLLTDTKLKMNSSEYSLYIVIL